MTATIDTPLIRLGNLFPEQRVYAKCEFLTLAGSFKMHGVRHLLNHLSQQAGTRQLVVPSMGNTAIAAAVGAREYGFAMTGVVPQTISRAKNERLLSLGVELIKVAGRGSELLRRAKDIAAERGAYFVHPHLDSLWTDGYQSIAQQILRDLSDCRSLVFPVGGGGLLMGLTEYLKELPRRPALFGCEAYNFPTYAHYDHARSSTLADGLILDEPHARVQERIAEFGIELVMVQEGAISAALADLFRAQGLAVEPSSVVTTAFVRAHVNNLKEPICVILTGENITREEFFQLVN